MPFIRAEFVDLSYALDAHRKQLDEALRVQMRQAARAWLRAVIVHVPVWTGMAKSSLKPLGRFLRVAIPIRPVAAPTALKNPALGEQQQDFTFEADGSDYSFSWETRVLHYQLNEFRPSDFIASAPWNSTAHGNAAFRRYVESVLPARIPRAEEFLHTHIIRVDRS